LPGDVGTLITAAHRDDDIGALSKVSGELLRLAVGEVISGE
jgi:hypothetical protein